MLLSSFWISWESLLFESTNGISISNDRTIWLHRKYRRNWYVFWILSPINRRIRIFQPGQAQAPSTLHEKMKDLRIISPISAIIGTSTIVYSLPISASALPIPFVVLERSPRHDTTKPYSAFSTAGFLAAFRHNSIGIEHRVRHWKEYWILIL